METQFQNLADLSRLPWFSVVDGRLTLKDRSLGPILDMHAHLALAYVRPMQLDMQKPSEWTEHYLPACCPLHMDCYANDNYTPEQLTAMKKDLMLGSLTSGGMRATHTVPNLAREMQEMGITHSVILPIDFPVLSHNTETALHAITGHQEFVGFCSVHPYARDVEAKLDAFKAMGARGIKVHPAVQTFRPDSRRAIELYRACARRGLPVLWHCGPVGIEPRLQRYLTQVRHYEKPIRECPETTFILGHAGARQADMALEFLNKYPNVWMEVSSQGVGSIKTLLTKGDSHRIMYGTDWPFYHQGIALAKVLMATDGDEKLRHRVLWGNAATLLNLPQ
jgi:predicted TIM-barrel fold metal-dependent hydrolase